MTAVKHMTQRERTNEYVNGRLKNQYLKNSKLMEIGFFGIYTPMIIMTIGFITVYALPQSIITLGRWLGI